MPKKAHREEQIVAVLRRVEAGARVDDICRKVGSAIRTTRKVWREGNVEQFPLSLLREERIRKGWKRLPAYIGVPAGCITKDASPVRWSGIRIRRRRHRTALMLDPTERQVGGWALVPHSDVVDEFTRECVGLKADRSMTGFKVAQAARTRTARAGPLAGEHYRGRRQ